MPTQVATLASVRVVVCNVIRVPPLPSEASTKLPVPLKLPLCSVPVPAENCVPLKRSTPTSVPLFFSSSTPGP